MLVNDTFRDFPIDFFTFSDLDFNNVGETEYSFTTENLELETGFIGNSLFEKIHFNHKETAIVNCAVGQGKTHAILHSIKEYLNTEESFDTFFVIAVPLVSLVTQYKNDLLEMGFEEGQIFSYESISDNIPDSGEAYININCKIHIVTVNTLLGNAGEHAVMQSSRKYNYIKTFAEELSKNGNRLIIVYDEIHEAIKNFTETGVAHLSHFSEVLWKNILLSATYNVQSIPVIKLLAKETNHKIRLLEAERVVTKAQSKMFLHFNNEYSSNKHTAITQLILELVREGKKIDVLSYSKSLCENLLNKTTEPGRKLTDTFGTLKKCTSTIENNQGDNDEDLTKNRFDNNYCNIGTNFKSGVNIKKENHAFVVILPPASARSTYANFNGIFSEGPNAVIQAIARQRAVGEIHIILPKPLKMDYTSLPDSMTQLQKDIFATEFSRLSIPTSDVPTTNNVEVKETSYIPFSKHKDEVDRWWQILKERYVMPMTLNPQLELPSYDNFVIMNGEKCTVKTNFLGKDLAGFVVYSAFTNQFFNAKLEDIFVPEVVTLENLESHLADVYENLERGNVSDTFASIERSVDLTAMTETTKRLARQKIFKYVIDQQGNVYDVDSKDSYRFILSYFDRFRGENRADLESQLLRFRELASANLVERIATRYYKPYVASPIFADHVDTIRIIIGRLKEIYPLQKDFANFFDGYLTSSDAQLGKKFYEFIIDITAKTVRRQTTVNTISGYYKVVIENY